ncbi:MucBP domain-containing protein [Lactococcus petauri]|uniref:MucBP domain-containing protein n=1 Tax=Lactococcus petauri TaxID=1940789 RepID=UPI00254D45A2|nr:MucBP domain-containing protein [Lactococcus petauri]
MKKILSMAMIVLLILPNLLLWGATDVHADIDQRVAEAKSESVSTLTQAVKNLISSNSQQHITTISTPLNKLYSYKTGESKKYSEGGPTWGKEAFVISMNPIYTVDGVDTSLLKVDYNRPGAGTTQTNPSSISITAKTNKKIDTSFWLEVRSVYTVWHTLVWETFSGSTEKTMYSQDLLDNPISIRVHVTKDNEEGSVKISYKDVDTGKSVINDNTIYGKIGQSFDQDVKADYDSKQEYILNQFYKYVGEKNTTGKYIDGVTEAEYQFERIQGGDVTVDHKNSETSLNDRQKSAFGNQLPDTLSGKYGSIKTAIARNIPHYETIDGKTEKQVTFNEKPQTTTFDYKLSQAKPLTIRYVDQDGNEIAGVDSKKITGKWGDDFVATPREEIPFYTLVDSKTPIKGYLKDEPQEIVYHYQVSEGAPVLVHYVDEQGQKLKEDKILSGLKFGQKFTEKAIDIDHYRQKKDEINGQITDKKQEITFVYSKNEGKPVLVDFKNKNDNIIHESYVFNGNYGIPYDVSEKNTDIQAIINKLDTKHYQLLSKKGELTGNLIDDPLEKYTSRVTYEFDKKQAPGIVTIKYINNKTGKEIEKSDKLTGKYDTFYTTQPKIIQNFHLSKMPNEISGTYGDESKEITYLYEPDIGGAVQLNFISKETQKPIDASEVKTGQVNQHYEFEAKKIPHYVLSEVPDNNKGKFPEANKVVNINFEYNRAKAKPVHVIYQDEAGNILDKEELQGKDKKWNDPFETEEKSFIGYTLNKVTLNGKEQSNGNGTYDDENEQTVTYVYEKAEGAPVTVKFVDEDGNSLSDAATLTGKYGDAYESKPANIKGWTVKTTPQNAKGSFTDEAQTVTYIYEKEEGAPVTVKFVDEDGNSLSDAATLTGKYGDAYESKPANIKGWTVKTTPQNAKGSFTDEAQTVTYVYTKNELPNITGMVLVKYVDTDGNKLSEDIVKSGTVGEGYSTEQKDIKGYTFKEIQGSATGQFKDQSQTVTYVYTKDKNDTVNPEPKPENKPSSNDKNNNQGTISSTQQGLPATGENERMALMSIGIGLILLMVALITSVFHFKRLKTINKK